MKDLSRVIRFDLRMARRNWVPIVIFLLIFLAMFVYCYMVYIQSQYLGFDPNRLLEEYGQERDSLMAAIEQGGMPSERVAWAEGRIRLLTFYLESGTVEKQYVLPFQLTNVQDIFVDLGFGVRSGAMAFVFLIPFVPYCFTRIALSHFSMGAKTVLMSPIKERTFLAGDMIVTIALTLIPLAGFIAMMAYGFVNDSGALILMDGPSGYYSLPISWLFWSMLAGLVTEIIVLVAITFLLYALFRVDYVAYGGPSLIVITLASLFAIASMRSPTLSNYAEAALQSSWPLIAVYQLSFYPGYPYPWVCDAIHIAVAIVIFIIGIIVYRRKGAVA